MTAQLPLLVVDVPGSASGHRRGPRRVARSRGLPRASYAWVAGPDPVDLEPQSRDIARAGIAAAREALAEAVRRSVAREEEAVARCLAA
jgi:hypothetical protein